MRDGRAEFRDYGPVAVCGCRCTVSGLRTIRIPAVPPSPGAAATGAGAAPPSSVAAAEATGAGAPGTVHVTRPKREALWKLPCPRMGDQATPPLFFMA